MTVRFYVIEVRHITSHTLEIIVNDMLSFLFSTDTEIDEDVFTKLVPTVSNVTKDEVSVYYLMMTTYNCRKIE
jgi:hypothetical protein